MHAAGSGEAAGLAAGQVAGMQIDVAAGMGAIGIGFDPRARGYPDIAPGDQHRARVSSGKRSVIASRELTAQIAGADHRAGSDRNLVPRLQQHVAAFGMHGATDHQRVGRRQQDPPVRLDQLEGVVIAGIDGAAAAGAMGAVCHPDRAGRIDRAREDAHLAAGVDPAGDLHLAVIAEFGLPRQQPVQVRRRSGRGLGFAQQSGHHRLRRRGHRQRSHVQHAALAHHQPVRVGEHHPPADVIADVAVERAVDQRARVPDQVDDGMGTVIQQQVDGIALADLEAPERIEVDRPARAPGTDVIDIGFRTGDRRTQVATAAGIRRGDGALPPCQAGQRNAKHRTDRNGERRRNDEGTGTTHGNAPAEVGVPQAMPRRNTK